MAFSMKHPVNTRLKALADKYGLDEIRVMDNIPGIDRSVLIVWKGDQEVNVKFDTGTDYELLVRKAALNLKAGGDPKWR